MERLKRYRKGLCTFLPAARRAARFLVLAVLALAAIAPPAFAAGVSLQWNPNSEPDLSGYFVHYGLASGSYTTHLDVGNTVNRSITGLSDNTTYYFALTARDTFGNESGYSNEVVLTTPPATTETISTPLVPSGPAGGYTGVAYTYTVSGAVSSNGDPVQYQFSWSDGSVSNWLAAGVTSASKTWSSPGTYTLVRVEARCSLHTTVMSSPSPALTVTIAAAPQETVSAPSAPSGPTNGAVGTANTYTAGGAVSSAGHSVEYRFSWSDGTVSQWLPAGAASASKTWNAPGTYTLVSVEARCALHPSIQSAVSPPITVTISSGVAESVSMPSDPAGPAGGDTGTTYVFSTGGSVSSTGDSVVYRFHWGDGTTSVWVGPGQPVTAGKSWAVPGTYLVQTEAACATHPTVGSFSPAVEVSIAAPASYVLWTNGGTGQAIRWKTDPATGAMTSWNWISPAAGVGKGWFVSSYTRGDATTDYVIWTNSGSGQAIRWSVDPATGTMAGWNWISRSAGVGRGWLVSSYARIDATTDYVIWTNSGTGQAVRWKTDPATGAMTSWNWISPAAGVGNGWLASSYTRGDATTDYVVWTNSGTGQAIRWKIDPATGAMTSWNWISPTVGVGKSWFVSSYMRGDATTDYVVWTNSGTGQAIRWKIDPATGATTSWNWISPTAGVGEGWQVGSFFY